MDARKKDCVGMTETKAEIISQPHIFSNLSLATSGGGCELFPLVRCASLAEAQQRWYLWVLSIPSRSISPLTTGDFPELRGGNFFSGSHVWSLQ